MPLKLCASCKSDAEAVTRLIYDAFEDNNFSKLMYPVPTSESIIVATSASTLKSWAQDPRKRHMQVKDSDTGELISYSSWFFQPQREGEDWKKMPEFHSPQGWYHDNVRTIRIKNTEACNRIMGPQPYLRRGCPIHLNTFYFYPILLCSYNLCHLLLPLESLPRWLT